MIKIYHNPRCRKSREGLAILEDSGKDYEVIEYLKNVPSEKEISDLIGLLKITPIDLVRKNEAIWKEQFKGKSLSDKEIIAAMATYPKLIERPIVINGKLAVIGRPTEIISSIL